MGELILPSDHYLFVSGIGSETFKLGYDSSTRVFDKSKTPMANPQTLYVAHINDDIARVAIEEQREVFFAQKHWIESEHPDDPRYFHKRALAQTATYAYHRALNHGGDKLVLFMRHPQLMLDGTDYEIGRAGPWGHIIPAKVRLEKVLRVASIEFAGGGSHQVTRLRLEDITVSL